MSVLLLEFNELSPRLMDRFIADGQLPNFKKLKAESATYITDAGEVPPNLEPWIQWVTVHTGLPFAEHKCFHLNDGASLSARRIWDHVGASGGKSWVCGSMNASFDDTVFEGHFLPDPWASDVPDFPCNYFKAFNDVVRPFVQEHSGKPKVSALEMVKFGKFMAENGLSAATVQATISQLLSERRKPSKWRRALILDRLQWDLFCGIYRREKPRFASFFINSTAHFQHFHWRELEPDLFDIKPSGADLETYGDAILDGYRNMDRIIGDALKLAAPGTAIVLCTALSQQPMLTYEHNEGRQIFRHRDIEALLAFAGVSEKCVYSPVMSQEFHLHCDSNVDAANVASKLEKIVLCDGSQVMWAYPIESKVNAGCMLSKDPGEQLLHTGDSAPAAFRDFFYPLESLRSGMHDPEGIFWVKASGIQPGSAADMSVPLLCVYPTIAELLGISLKTPYARSVLKAEEYLEYQDNAAA